MRYSISSLLAAAGFALALTQQCTGDAVDEGGNWFCGAVRHILYEGLGGKGTYRAVTNMGNDGICQMEDKSYGGPLAPLDEDLSLHFRGPLQLKEMAVYNPTLSPRQPRKKRHPLSHHRLHHRHRAVHLKEREDWVTATINGQTVSWVNDQVGPSTPTPTPPVALSALSEPASEASVLSASALPIGATPEQAQGAQKNGGNQIKAPMIQYPPPSVDGDWDRVAYYNSETQVADNVMFLGNYGGQSSGVWDATWGNSLSFLNANASGGAPSPQILGDVSIPSNKEFAIFSAEKCDGSCGYSRDEKTAYKGFAGANKVFLFHFMMPHDSDQGFNGDMPALWALNARIPRTAQYSSCNCWASGCGEADIFEALAPGDVKCKSTIHLASGAGSSDWFPRPVDKFIKVATVFDETQGSVSIRVLPDDVDFSEALDAATVQAWVSSGDGSPGSSVFQVSPGTD